MKENILIALAIVLLGSMWLQFSMKANNNRYDVVSNGKTVNTVLVKDGAVSMIYADCPDGVCTAHTPISRAGERIICLPNRVEISIESSSSNELDGVAR